MRDLASAIKIKAKCDGEEMLGSFKAQVQFTSEKSLCVNVDSPKQFDADFERPKVPYLDSGRPKMVPFPDFPLNYFSVSNVYCHSHFHYHQTKKIKKVQVPKKREFPILFSSLSDEIVFKESLFTFANLQSSQEIQKRQNTPISRNKRDQVAFSGNKELKEQAGGSNTLTEKENTKKKTEESDSEGLLSQIGQTFSFQEKYSEKEIKKDKDCLEPVYPFETFCNFDQ